LQVPIDKNHLYETTLPSRTEDDEDNKDDENTTLDVLIKYAKDNVKLEVTNLCSGPNGLGRRPGGAELALLRERGGKPIMVVRRLPVLASCSASLVAVPGFTVCLLL